MTENIIKLKKLYPDVELPSYATIGSSGFDLKIHNFKAIHGAQNNQERLNYFIVNADRDSVLLLPHQRLLCGCGFSLEIPRGTELQIRTRSGMALKQGLIVCNSPGTLDEDYRGEVMLILLNTSSFEINISRGEKMGQAILTSYYKAEFLEVKELSETIRGEGGLGSTGK